MNSMRRILSISCIFFMICSFSALAQNTSFMVKAVLVDSLTMETEPYATVRIMKSSDLQNPVKLGVTDEKGRFEGKLPESGNYVLTITSIGKRPVIRNFELTNSKPQVDLGTLFMQEATEELKGIEVVAQKPLVKAEIDKITYSIEDDPDSKTNSTLEMLRKVPMVTVDGEDNIQVNGSSSFKVYVNNEPNTLMSNNPKEVLRSLPANSIKSIEVITEPGAKYDAEGVGGILNIVTQGARMQGYTATVGTNVSNMGIGGNVYATVQSGKFTVTGNYSYNKDDSPASKNASGREDFTSTDMRYLSTKGEMNSAGHVQFGFLEGSYEIDTLNLVTFSMNLFNGSFKTPTTTFTEMANASHQRMYSFKSIGNGKMGFSNIGGNIDYQHSFKKKGEFLTLSYKLDNSPQSTDNETIYDELFQVPYTLQNQYYESDSHTTEHTGQIDYVNPISDKHYIDFGGKYIYRSNASDSKMFIEDDNKQRIQNIDQSSDYEQNRNILALYGDYQLKLNKWGFKAGLRYEHSFMNVKYNLMPERNFSANFDDIVPTVNVSYMLGMTSTLRFNYNMRINRPGIWYLDPFRNTTNPTSISYGNPDLDTEKAHTLGLTYSSFSAKFNINLGLNYGFINNGIETYSFMNNGVMETTYGNVGKTQRSSVSAWLNWNPGNKTRISINATESYTDYKSVELNAHKSGFSTNIFVNAQQTLPWDLRLSLFGGGSSKAVTLQGTGASFKFYGISLSKAFLKEKRLNISLSANNFFHKYLDIDSETITSTFRSWTKNSSPQRTIRLNISWRFGKLNASVKHTNRSITNDDVKAGGENQGQGATTPTN